MRDVAIRCVAAGLLAALCTACGDSPSVVAAPAELPTKPDVLAHPGYAAFAADLRPGDVIFRGRSGGWGELGARLSDMDTRYGHVGVVAEDEGGGLSVIHASGDPLTPEGRVRRDPLEAFLSRARRTGAYRPSLEPAQMEAFLRRLDGHVRDRTPFDPAYSLDTADALYCTEMVWRAWSVATASEPVPERTEWRDRDVIAIDDLQLSPGLSLVAELDVETVATTGAGVGKRLDGDAKSH